MHTSKWLNGTRTHIHTYRTHAFLWHAEITQLVAARKRAQQQRRKVPTPTKNSPDQKVEKKERKNTATSANSSPAAASTWIIIKRTRLCIGCACVCAGVRACACVRDTCAYFLLNLFAPYRFYNLSCRCFEYFLCWWCWILNVTHYPCHLYFLLRLFFSHFCSETSNTTKSRGIEIESDDDDAPAAVFGKANSSPAVVCAN